MEQTTNSEQENSGQRTGGRTLSGWRLFALAAAVCAVSLGAMIFALGRTGETADFVPPPFEADAETGTPEPPEDLDWQELDAEAFRFSVCGVFAPENGRADVWLTDPAESEAWLKLRVLDTEGTILGETGLIRPGEYVRSVALDTMPEEGEAVIMLVMAYEPETYHSLGSASLNTTVKGEAP